MNFLVNLFSSSYQELWKSIIRPYRDNYTNKDLGPEKFRINQRYYKRSDFYLINNRNIKLMCSFWEPYDKEREYTHLPCVIYLHGNSSSRCEVVPNLKYLLPLNITVFAFDFAACGHSDGEYISLGWYEAQDVQCVVNFLRNTNKVSSIGIWGRSMGAVTSVMYASKDPSISGIFLDSPFYSLNLLIDELSIDRVSLPNFLVRQVIKMLKETVKEKAGFNIDDIEPGEYAKKCFVPAFFCHGKDDNFVDVHHCKDLYLIYPGEKNIFLIEGEHNSLRPNELNEKASEFFYHALKCKYIRELNDCYYGCKMFFRDWNNPNYRTPKEEENNNDKIANNKSKNISYKKIYINNNFDDNKGINKEEEMKANKDKYKNNDNSGEPNFNNKKYKFKNYNSNNQNKKNENEDIDLNNKSYKSNGQFQKVKYRPSSSKELYDYKTFDKTKIEDKQNPSLYNLTNSKILNTQRFYQNYDINKINNEKINNKNINNQMYKDTTHITHKINNDENIYYNNTQNYNYNYDDNTINGKEQYKKKQTKYASPKNSIRYQYPKPSLININNSENIVNSSPKNNKSINPTYLVNISDNSPRKNYKHIPFINNNNNNKIYTNNIYYSDIQIYKEYDNNYNNKIYSNKAEI